MNKYRVLQVVADLALGGAERMAVHLLRGLDRERFETEVISIWGPKGTELEEVLAAQGIPVRYSGKRRGFDPRAIAKIDRVVRTFRPHVIHTHTGGLRYALPSMLYRRVPAMVHTIHNLAEREVDRLIREVHRWAFHLGVVPVAIAQEVLASMGRVYGIRGCPMIPNGIRVVDYQRPAMPRAEWRKREGFPVGAVSFVTVGRLVPQKNHPLLLKAFAVVRGADPGARLWIVGEPRRKTKAADLKELVARLHIGDNVDFLGPRTDIPDVLAAADVFVLSSDYEGNPLTVMEAMAAAKPVISTAVGGVPELVEDGQNGILVPPGDAKTLADAMIKLSASPEAVRSMGRSAARRAVTRFDHSQMANAYAQLYERLLGQKRCSAAYHLN